MATIKVDMISLNGRTSHSETFAMDAGASHAVHTPSGPQLFFDCGQGVQAISFSAPFLPISSQATAWRPLPELPVTGVPRTPTSRSARRPSTGRVGRPPGRVAVNANQNPPNFLFSDTAMHRAAPPNRPVRPTKGSRSKPTTPDPKRAARSASNANESEATDRRNSGGSGRPRRAQRNRTSTLDGEALRSLLGPDKSSSDDVPQDETHSDFELEGESSSSKSEASCATDESDVDPPSDEKQIETMESEMEQLEQLELNATRSRAGAKRRGRPGAGSRDAGRLVVTPVEVGPEPHTPPTPTGRKKAQAKRGRASPKPRNSGNRVSRVALPSWNEVNTAIGEDGVPRILSHANDDDIIVRVLHDLGASEVVRSPMTTLLHPTDPAPPLYHQTPHTLLDAMESGCSIDEEIHEGIDFCPRAVLATASNPSTIGTDLIDTSHSLLTLWLVPLCKHESCIDRMTGDLSAPNSPGMSDGVGSRHRLTVGKTFRLRGPDGGISSAHILDVEWLAGARDLVGGIGGVVSVTTTEHIGLYPIPISFWYDSAEQTVLQNAREYPYSTPEWLLANDQRSFGTLGTELVAIRGIQTTCRTPEGASHPDHSPFVVPCVMGLEMNHPCELISCGSAKLIWPRPSSRRERAAALRQLPGASYESSTTANGCHNIIMVPQRVSYDVPQIVLPVPEECGPPFQGFHDHTNLDWWFTSDLEGPGNEPYIALVLGKSIGSLLWQSFNLSTTAGPQICADSPWMMSSSSYLKAHRDDEASQPASRPMTVRFNPDPTGTMIVVGRASSHVTIYDLKPSARFPVATPVIEWESAHRHTVSVAWSPVQRYLISSHTSGLMHNLESFETTNHGVNRAMILNDSKVPISVQIADRQYKQWKARRDNIVERVVNSFLGTAGNGDTDSPETPTSLVCLPIREGPVTKLFGVLRTSKELPIDDDRLEAVRLLGETIPCGAGIERRSLCCAASGSSMIFGFDDGVSVACSAMDLERKTYDRASVVCSIPLPALYRRPEEAGGTDFIGLPVLEPGDSDGCNLTPRTNVNDVIRPLAESNTEVGKLVDKYDDASNLGNRLKGRYVEHFNKLECWRESSFFSLRSDPDAMNDGEKTHRLAPSERLGMHFIVGKFSDVKARFETSARTLRQIDAKLPPVPAPAADAWLTKEQCESLVMRAATWDRLGVDFPSGPLAFSAVGSVDTWNTSIGMSTPWIASCNRGGIIHLQCV